MKPGIQPAKTSLRTGDAVLLAGAPLVSVVVPTRDRPQLLERALRSALTQTMPDLEVIVVDDASRTPVNSVVAAAEDARIRVVRRNMSGGPGAARNTGIAEARGEWVAFLDDDDEWLPEKLELQLARLAGAPEASIVYCLCLVQIASALMPPRFQPPLPEGDVAASVLNDTHQITPCAHVVKRSALLSVGGFDEAYFSTGDSDLWVRLSLAGYRTVAVPQALVIQHAEHKRRVTQDPAVLSAGYARFERRWRGLAKALLGQEYMGIRTRMRAELEPLHQRHVKRLVRKGNRWRAWRYIRSMVPVLPSFPWATAYLVQASSVVVLGEWATRLPGMPRRKPAAEGKADGLASTLDEVI